VHEGGVSLRVVTPDEAASYRTGPLPVVNTERRTDPVALARVRGRLSGGPKRHLEQLIAEWHILADFCFSDLLLFVPIDDDAERFGVVGEVRPSTCQTLYRSDMIGRAASTSARWCSCTTSPSCAVASGSWSARTPPSVRSTTG
jgi:hypothetical protein